MYISLNWLKDYVQLPPEKTAKEIAEDLTMHTVEIESIKSTHELLKGILVGQVTTVEPHPNADKLRIALVDDGTKTVKRVVCGGTNLYDGMLVAYAPPGASVKWHGEGEPVVIEEAVIRGVQSAGMICAAEEIGLEAATSQEGTPVVDLKEYGIGEEKIGNNVFKIFEERGEVDTIIEVDNKSMTHRADLWGHYGIARELAALYNVPLKTLDELAPKIQEPSSPNDKLTVSLQKESNAKVIHMVRLQGVREKPSSQQRQRRLRAIGVTPRNAIIDATNYVMFELGQPTHAYDAATIAKTEIRVENANSDEKITVLDGGDHVLTNEDVVIRDGNNRAIALAGVMGGAETQITESTTEVVLESGCFHPAKTRRTAMRHNLKTDASMRFEKTPDAIDQPRRGLQRLVYLLQQEYPDAIVTSSVATAQQEGFEEWTSATVKTSVPWLQQQIGADIPKKEMIDFLQRLQFSVEETGDALSIKAPFHRTPKDISIPQDIVEEVARVYGYDKIEPELPQVPIAPPTQNMERQREWKIRDVLASRGLTEVLNYVFVGETDLKLLQQDKKDFIHMENSLSAHQTMLRTTMVSGMLSDIEKNQRAHGEIAIFEIGKVFDKHKRGAFATLKGDVRLPREEAHLAIAMTGSNAILNVQREVENLLNCLNIEHCIEPSDKTMPWMHPARTGEMIVNGERIGVVTQIHPRIEKAIESQTTIGYAELSLTLLLEQEHMAERKRAFRESSKYPDVKFDFSFLVSKETLWSQIQEAMQFTSGVIRSLEVFDVYQGKGVPEGKKRIAFHVRAGADDHTLNEQEIEKLRSEMITVAKKLFHAELVGE